MRPNLSWLGQASISSTRIALFISHHLSKNVKRGIAQRHRYTSSGAPRALTSSTNSLDTSETFESLLFSAGYGSSIHRAKRSGKLENTISREDDVQNELPPSDSHYQMTEELFRAAKQAESGSVDSFWSHRLYRGPVVDGVQTRPVVHYCRSSRSTENVLESHFMDKKVIGFDIEWRADALRFHGPRANVSLIQIASEERIGLFHVALYPKGDELVPPLMRKIMEDPNITKVGVSIKSDCTRIRKNLDVECRGLFELSHLFKLVKFSQNKNFSLIDKKLVALAKQVQEHFHLPLFKGGDVRHSDWSKKLQLHQMVYAAADAYAAVQLYITLELKRKSLIPTPPRPHHADLNIPIQYTEETEVTYPDAKAIIKPGRINSNTVSTLSSQIKSGPPVGKISAEGDAVVKEKNESKLVRSNLSVDNAQEESVVGGVKSERAKNRIKLKNDVKILLTEDYPLIPESPINHHSAFQAMCKTETSETSSHHKIDSELVRKEETPIVPPIPKKKYLPLIGTVISFY